MPVNWKPATAPAGGTVRPGEHAAEYEGRRLAVYEGLPDGQWFYEIDGGPPSVPFPTDERAMTAAVAAVRRAVAAETKPEPEEP